MKKIARLTAIGIVCFSLAACGAAPLRNAVPEAGAYNALVSGYSSNIRALGDEAPKNLGAVIEKRIAQYKTANTAYYEANGTYPPMIYLAISGGGENGAFGAGVLYGWSQAGTRPEFNIVTGVSTGALIAPFAFLGQEYDNDLKEVYTTLSSKNIFFHTVSTIFDGLTGGMALTDNTPLASMIEKKITPEMLAKIGEAHRQGRRLLIGTTNLETQRNIIWDIGAIANSGRPDALELCHKVMLASAAIPGAFSPVFIDVTVDGQKYNEMHVDGGVTAQVFLYPLQSSVDEKKIFADNGIRRELYVIRNAKIVPEYKVVPPRLVSLSQRSIETLIKNQGIGDLFRLYAGAYRDGIDYNLIYIPQDFSGVSKELFDPEYMSRLFDLGAQLGGTETPWMEAPPNFAIVRQQYTEDKTAE